MTKPLRVLAEQAFSRTAGAPLVAGNSVRVLKDSGENYPAWLEAIGCAKERIFFDNYIVADDAVGRQFVEALAERARAGVRVKAMHDWFGDLGAGSSRLWRPLVAAGGEVRRFNPPRLDSPFGWLTRDHRKLLSVDREVGFVSGLCVSSKWDGDRARGVEPWRDTGVEVRGPAVADIDEAFSQVWAATGAPLEPDELAKRSGVTPAGEVTLRVLATIPSTAGLYRLDQLIAAMATRTLWLTDAYFLGVAPYVQALRAAAHDGVDVRLLVPGTSDVAWVSHVSRAGYRPLLEAGIRVFEWNGSMLHAKSAVADGRWARVGSTNLNLASWIGNYELDVAIEDDQVAATLQDLYESDLEHSTEIVLDPRRRLRATAATVKRKHRRGTGSASRAAAGALRLTHSVGAAITDRRILGRAEAGVMAGMGAALIALAVLGIVWPRVLAVPLVVLGGWVGVSLMIRARELYNRPRSEDQDASRTAGGADSR